MKTAIILLIAAAFSSTQAVRLEAPDSQPEVDQLVELQQGADATWGRDQMNNRYTWNFFQAKI